MYVHVVFADEMDEKGSEWPQTSEIASGIYSWECYGKKRIIHCHPELWTSLRSIAEHFRAHPTPGVEFTIHVGHLKNWKCTILPKEESETVSTATVSPSQSVESSIETTFPLDRLVHRRMYPQACIPMAVMWDFDFVQPPPVPIDWTNVNWESVTSQDGIAINRKPRM